jgi:hypothetical protein
MMSGIARLRLRLQEAKSSVLLARAAGEVAPSVRQPGLKKIRNPHSPDLETPVKAGFSGF